MKEKILKTVSSIIGKGVEGFTTNFSRESGKESAKVLWEKEDWVPNIDTKSIIEFMEKEIDWENINTNTNNISKAIRAAAVPIAVGAVSYFCLPVLTGATVFAFTNTGAAAVTYGTTKIITLVGTAVWVAKNEYDVFKEEEE